MDARDLRDGEDAKNLHLETRTDKEGKVNNGLPYSTSQLEAIAKVAGDNKQDILDKEGNVIGTAYGVRADIMLKPNNKGVTHAYINTKTLGEATQPLPENVKSAQIEAMSQSKAEPAVEEVKEEAPKAAAKEEKAEETKAEKATAKEVNKNALQAKISQLDNLFVSLAGQELSEDKQIKTVSAAVELNKAKDLAASASVTQEQVDAQVAALEAAINNLNKVEKTTDKREEAKKEEKSETKVAKENLEKAVSEAKAVNQAATTFATKEVKEGI